MKKILQSHAFVIGLTMFSMFFGAGNVIFPLAVGQYAGDKNIFSIIGLLLTAVLIPFSGVIAMILYDGNYRTFFSRIGKKPGFFLALFILLIIGPFGGIPRCITLSFSSVKAIFPSISLFIFSLVSCLLLFLFSIRQTSLLTIIGKILTPLLLVGLLSIIGIGLFSPHDMKVSMDSGRDLFLYGLKEGYNTMDLLAAFFFSSTIIHVLRKRRHDAMTRQDEMKEVIKASLIGAFLLGLIYMGFSFIASFHSNIATCAKEDLLSLITMKVLGAKAGFVVCITVALACLTTAIALITIFSEFIQKEVFLKKFSYPTVLIGSLLITFLISICEFSGIMTFLAPVLKVCYPGLILLTLVNIAYRWKKSVA